VVNIRTADLPLDVLDISADGIAFHKGPLIAELRSREQNIQAELATLWTHPPPASLRARRDHAQQLSDQWLGRITEDVDTLQATAPDPVSQSEGDALDRPADVQLRAQVNDAMTSLAGQGCDVAG
jgi:hypothetical protein